MTNYLFSLPQESGSTVMSAATASPVNVSEQGPQLVGEQSANAGLNLGGDAPDSEKHFSDEDEQEINDGSDPQASILLADLVKAKLGMAQVFVSVLETLVCFSVLPPPVIHRIPVPTPESHSRCADLELTIVE
jgi:hypothetical protein